MSLRHGKGRASPLERWNFVAGRCRLLVCVSLAAGRCSRSRAAAVMRN